MAKIPNFKVQKARNFVLEFKDPYAKLLLKREVDLIPIDSKEFLYLQEQLFKEKGLIKLMDKQLATGAWLLPEKEDVFGPLQKSTTWTLVLLGLMGLNGTIERKIEKAVEYIFETQYDYNTNTFHNHHEFWGDFMQSHNASILRALIRLGFTDNKDVKNASIAHLDLIHDKEGYCKYKKGNLKCAWGLIKNLLFLNEWPDSWKNSKVKESITACQNYLLAYDLSTANYPRLAEKPNNKWMRFSYFKTYHSDIFEALEALVTSGISDHPVISKTLDAIGKRCSNEKTWLCELNVNMQLKLEKNGHESPWLSIRGLKINNTPT